MSPQPVREWVTITRDNGTTFQELHDVEGGVRCDQKLFCGGTCCLAHGHTGEHSCDGDDEKPGDCPA